MSDAKENTGEKLCCVDRKTWLAFHTEEFEKSRQSNPVIHAAMKLVQYDRVPLINALQIACVELARQNDELRRHVNIPQATEVRISAPPTKGSHS